MGEIKTGRPTKTPDGLDFPYSHFGDPAEREKLLRDIADRLDLAPQVVLNMGSGYDITPSDAFPDARVVHVDLEPPAYIEGAVNIVEFLKAHGFEAYDSRQLPEDFQADLGIDILGPGIEGRLIKLGGVVISTAHDVPEGMKLIALVDDNEPRIVVTDPGEMDILWQARQSPMVHLVVTRRVNST